MVATFHIEPDSDNVAKLNNLLNNKSKKVMYVVHRPGCPACDAFMPNWHQFEDNMKKKALKDVVLAKINVSGLTMVDLKDKHNIMGVPHVVMQNGNKLEEYMGNRDPQDLENWLLRSYTKKMMGGKKTIKKHKSIRRRKGKSRKSTEKNKIRSSKRRKSKK
jgi:thiol-disulfide isomerase/thioredoxin